MTWTSGIYVTMHENVHLIHPAQKQKGIKCLETDEILYKNEHVEEAPPQGHHWLARDSVLLEGTNQLWGKNVI